MLDTHDRFNSLVEVEVSGEAMSLGTPMEQWLPDAEEIIVG
jgi:hypothetical protein